MSILFWVLAILTVTLAALQLRTAVQVRGHYRPIDSDVPSERPAVSVLVPLVGAVPGLRQRLDTLVKATRGGDLTHLGDQLLLVPAAADDPTHTVAEDLRRAHPTRDISIVLAHPEGGQLSTGQALDAALDHADHAMIACMADDVVLDPANLDEGVRLAGVKDAGAVFAIPYYAGNGSIGGRLVAAFNNYGLVPTLASLATQGAPRFIIDGFWVTTRTALDVAGGLAHHGGGHGLGSAIGRAMRAAGRRNRAMRRPVRREQAALAALEAARDVLGHLAPLRAQGAILFTMLALSWNALALALVAGLVGWAAPGIAAGVAAAVVGVTVLLRSAVVLVLNRGAYRALPRTRYLATTLLFEAAVGPWLCLIATVRGPVSAAATPTPTGPGNGTRPSPRRR